MKVGVLALQGDVREHIRSLGDCGVTATSVRRPEEIASIDALVIPGGESTTIAKLARSFGVFDLIAERIRSGMPVYGSCAGMILIANKVLDAIEGQETFGGIDAVVRRNAFGRQVDSFETDLQFEGITDHPVRAIFIRAPWVESVSHEVKVLASVDGHPVAIRQGNLFATSLIDSKRSRAFAKYIKAIEVSARNGGADPAGNPTLYDAIQKAKKNSVPSDNIERALKRASGQDESASNWETIMYEGYGPGGVALLIECLSDNRNRAASEVRVAVTRNGGTMADPGSVAYMFNRKGVVIVKKSQGNSTLTEDQVLETVLDVGAEEVNDLGETFEVVSGASEMVAIRSALQGAGIDYESADVSFLPSLSIPLDASAAKDLFELIDAIEECDDVQNVYGNFDVSEEVMASLS